MKTFYYKQTVVYLLAIQADTAEAADAIANDTDVLADNVIANYEGWQEDGVE
jgi:hypothetical protein